MSASSPLVIFFFSSFVPLAFFALRKRFMSSMKGFFFSCDNDLVNAENGLLPECAFFVDDDVVVGVVVVVGVCAATHCSESARTQKVRMAERGARR